ncbi:MAG: DUF6514 family protein [Lachnospiraceae bacterium]|nr:DUF6514 family protein [Lachnospiraceae bacterium]
MDRLYLIGSREFQAGNQKQFIVYYYIHINEKKGIYGIRLEQKFQETQNEIEYAEEKGITESRMVAEELVKYLFDSEVMPISLPETIDAFFTEKE